MDWTSDVQPAVYNMDMNRRRVNYINRIVRVKSCSGGYQLPDGLPEGASVKIVGVDIGRFYVDYRGEVYNIAMACAEVGETIKRT